MVVVEERRGIKLVWLAVRDSVRYLVRRAGKIGFISNLPIDFFNIGVNS